MRCLLNMVFLVTLAGLALGQVSGPALTLKQKIARFSPTVITADIAILSAGDRRALDKLIESLPYIDSIYLVQVWDKNFDLLHRLEADTSADGEEKLHYFRINMSPWSMLDNNEAFIEGVPAHPPDGANYYPENMSKDEFTTWVESLPGGEKEKARGFFSIIVRGKDQTLQIRPYNEAYAAYLSPAAKLLKEAAEAADNPTLKTFLQKRGEAFLTNDYYESDIAWMDLDSPIEPTIGPYEVYLDNLFNYKAAFEAFIGIRDEQETKKLDLFSAHLQEIEDTLPIPAAFRNPKLGAMSPIRVVNEVAVGGEALAGVQTAAYNLPNDERVIQAKGSKRVMLKNVQEAKFNKCLVPISALALPSDQQAMVSFEPFFTHILAHELMHGLGPHTITLNGKKTTVRQEMKEIGSSLEEAKADISGLFALQHLIDRNVLNPSLEKPMYVTFLASLFRSVRFGIHEAHGKGSALQFNYLTDEGGFVYDPSSRTFSVDFGKIKNAVKKLTGVIMLLQADGNYAQAKSLLEKYSVIRPEMQVVLDRLTAVPVDIEPQFPLGK